MIQLKQITLTRSHKILLRQADLTLFAGQKVGLIGKNGSGKTSLFMMLQGELPPEEGELSIPKQIKMAHLQQEILETEMNALDYVLSGDAAFHSLNQAIKAAEQQNDGMLLAELHTRMAEIDGYSQPSKAATIIHGLGFSNEELVKPMRAFSGGWQMRLNLARVLMDRADLLLLDEPTNHLDLETITWLEQWLQQSSQTIVLISHDRDFMDRVVTHIAHLHEKQLKFYTGNYSQFETQRAIALQLQEAAYKKHEAKRQHLQSFVDRFRAKATKARQAQARIKMLARMEEVLPVQLENPFRFDFRDTLPAGNPMLILEQVVASYEDKIILKNVNVAIRDGDRIGLLGKNGAGKSTLIKIIQAELLPKKGKIHRSPKLKIGYFAQHQLDLLHPENSPLTHLLTIDKAMSETQARKYLGSFHFSNDDVFRRIGSFSGGEKSRLALASIIWQKPNLLLLDEPTNHLDLEMREALNLALQDYTGAVILVSHDRHLLNCTSNEFWLVSNNQVTPFQGDLQSYQTLLVEKNKKNESGKNKKALEPKQTNTHASEIKELENTLQKLEISLSELDHQLNDEQLYHLDNKTTLQQLVQERDLLKEKITAIEEKLLKFYD